jgi:signal transduction histidine kinase
MSDDLVKRLREFASPAAEVLDDGYRLTKMCHQSHEAADRIEKLEAANKLLNEQLDSIEEMGTESLNALPDCLMQLAPALVENDELKAKLAEAMEALREVSQALDWQAHGACRGWSDNLLTPVNALKLARITIAKIIGEQP